MHKTIRQVLAHIDERLPHLDSRQLQGEFEKIPIEIFGKIQIDRPQEFSNLMSWFPGMPSDDVQRSWTGTSGHPLMNQSISFIRLAMTRYRSSECVSGGNGNVLDFGCGWGRLTRLLYKYFPVENIFCVDAWDRSIDLCRYHRVHGQLAVSDYLPRSLPTPRDLKFDLIIAFSVFTHLSEKTASICSRALRDCLSDTGMIALTIRPVEYWSFMGSMFTDQQIHQFVASHEQNGFAFFPHNRESVEGEVTYGDTSMSLEYIDKNFGGLRIFGVEWSEMDPLQIIVFLRKEDL